jgi:chromatin remodeling complex protein RSC6
MAKKATKTKEETPATTVQEVQPVQEDKPKKAKTVAPKKQKKEVVKVEEELVEEEDVAVEGENAQEDGSEKKKRTVPTRDSVLAEFDELIASVEKEIEVLRDSSTKTKGVKFLRTLGKRLKALKGHSTRIISKRSSAPRKTGTNTSSGFLKPVKISKEMSKFTGWDTKELKSRVDVTKFLCNYIREHKLQNEGDKRQINPDQKLQKLLNYDPKTSTQPLTYYHLQTLLKSHFPKPEAAAITA